MQDVGLSQQIAARREKRECILISRNSLLGFLLLGGIAAATPSPYHKVLKWKNLAFSIQGSEVSGSWHYQLQPKGLAISNQAVQGPSMVP